MRYFFSLPSPEPTLAGCIIVPALVCRAVQRARSVPALFASEPGALTGTVGVSPVAVPTDKDLATAAGTQVVTGTGQHRREKADEGWIYTCSGATLVRLCESTV